MVSPANFRVFLSAVSSEFERARSQVADDLRKKQLEVKVQDDFRQEADADTTLRKLHDYIAACSAVLCIVGQRSGMLPPDAAVQAFASFLPPELPKASYTQWELLFARHFRKPLYLYTAEPQYVPDKPEPTSPEDSELQRRFLAYLASQGLDFTPFPTVDELRPLVLVQDWPQGPALEPIVPKGLRSFDANDAGFFLQLLPGPFDTDGLPESIRFWKHCIETSDEAPFTVGVIYGPSGCGKSSLIKAGLIPHLISRIRTAYVEASADDTEARLLKALRVRCPDLPIDLDLNATIAALGDGQELAPGQKVLIVLDQFEQWLHARRGQQDTELVRALRQCDGRHTQVLVTVRDDFWLPSCRFMGELEINLVQGQNMAVVDLFDTIHARNVLQAFGRAYGRLANQPTPEQANFLDMAVQDLAEDGRVICVRLALFAQMVKGKPWIEETLKGLGGTEGVGVTFLEETFSDPRADARCRHHQQAARGVLKALLPEQGSNIKGQMRSREDLLMAAGYQSRPQDFAELLRILDAELRLVTPTHHETTDEGSNGQAAGSLASYYQLTHDYLVPSLREWLTRKQRETRRGRAELLLAERSAAWNAKPESRLLPSALEYARIRLLTRPQHWTASHSRMMQRAGRVHLQRGATLLLVLAVLSFAGLSIRSRILEQQDMQQAKGLVAALLKADIGQVPAIVQEIGTYHLWVDPLLRAAYDEHPADSPERLRVALALLPVDPSQVDYLRGRLLVCDPATLPVIRDALAGYRAELLQRLWEVVQDEKASVGERFNAACALATYDPGESSPADENWKNASPFIANQLVAALLRDPSHYALVLDALRPACRHLLAPLGKIFRDAARSDSERSIATTVLADYAKDDSAFLADLALDADASQFAVIYPVMAKDDKSAVALLHNELARKLTDDPNDPQNEPLAKRQANAAAALVRLGATDKVWPLFKHPGSPQRFGDPRVRSYLIDRLAPLGCDPQAIITRLDQEQDVSARWALILTLGQFGTDKLPAADRGPLVEKFGGLYRDDPDSGIHGACEWLLRIWGQGARLSKIDHDELKGKPADKKLWYVNGQGQTLAIIRGPVEFTIGSPPNEPDREDKYEQQHEKPINRSFAIATHEVTLAEFTKREFLAFRERYTSKAYEPNVQYLSPDGKLDRRCPANLVSWYDAAAYCNWLTEQEEKAGTIAKDQQCYEPNQEGKFAEGMKPADDYLHRSGYRLPTEAEWEYACRAFAATSRYYGQTIDLLPHYAWYAKNSLDRWMLPVGSLLPNDLGLFDMQGNALEWCQEICYVSYSAGADVEFKGSVKDGEVRVLRGGSFDDRPANVRSASRYRYRPTFRFVNLGFRPARTYP